VRLRQKVFNSSLRAFEELSIRMPQSAFEANWQSDLAPVATDESESIFRTGGT
jgi:hypothetical protein